LPRIARWGRSKTDTSIVKWRRALVVLASAGGNDVATIDRAGPDQPVSLRAPAKKALHRDSIQYRRHNACEASCAKVAATGLARR
jgi:hypothetical protein